MLPHLGGTIAVAGSGGLANLDGEAAGEVAAGIDPVQGVIFLGDADAAIDEGLDDSAVADQLVDAAGSAVVVSATTTAGTSGCCGGWSCLSASFTLARSCVSMLATSSPLSAFATA